MHAYIVYMYSITYTLHIYYVCMHVHIICLKI